MNAPFLASSNETKDTFFFCFSADFLINVNVLKPMNYMIKRWIKRFSKSALNFDHLMAAEL